MRTGPGWVVLQHAAYEGPGAIADALTSGGHDYDVVRIDRGDPIPDPDRAGEMTGLVVMGGPMSVHDDEAHPWLAQERALLHAAVEAGLPVLGVCLGAQQLAAALGGVVAPGPAPEVGVGEVHLIPSSVTDPVFAPAATPLPCMHWHGDTFTLPPGAELLASSEAYPHQAFRFGPRAYALQFHVEITAELAGHWASHLPPGVFVRASDIASIRRGGDGVLRRFVALASRPEVN
jgi:GMP synthase-like glutamine amidotransferase